MKKLKPQKRLEAERLAAEAAQAAKEEAARVEAEKLEAERLVALEKQKAAEAALEEERNRGFFSKLFGRFFK